MGGFLCIRRIPLPDNDFRTCILNHFSATTRTVYDCSPPRRFLRSTANPKFTNGLRCTRNNSCGLALIVLFSGVVEEGTLVRTRDCCAIAACAFQGKVDSRSAAVGAASGNGKVLRFRSRTCQRLTGGHTSKPLRNHMLQGIGNEKKLPS